MQRKLEKLISADCKSAKHLPAQFRQLYKCPLFQVFQGRQPPPRPGPEDGGPNLQRSRHQLLLQRPGGVRPGPHRRCEQRRQRPGAEQLQLPNGRVPDDRGLHRGVPRHRRDARRRRLDAQTRLQIQKNQRKLQYLQ